MRFEVEVVRDAQGFDSLREEWSSLLAESDADTIFLTWEWLHSWWKHASSGLRLSIFTVRRDGELVAVAPLAFRPGFAWFVPPRLSFLGTGAVGSDYLDIVAKRGWEREALSAITDHLKRSRFAIDLQGVRAEGSLATELLAPLEDLGFRKFPAKTQTCPFIPLAGKSWETFFAGLGREHRYNFKRRLRRLEEKGELRFERVSSEERRGEALAILFELHERRWSRRGGSNAFARREVLDFHEEVSRLALERGWLRLFVLWVSGQPAAALYGFRYRGAFLFYQSGFDPRFARWGVGLVTLGLTIQSAIEEGALEFDFLHGDEAYKFLWARHRRDLMRLEVDPPGAGAFLHRGSAQVSRALRRFARRFVPLTVANRLAQWRAGLLGA